MLGNDIVDLGDPESADAGRHPRFDARVFDPAERVVIAASPAPGRTRWLLWAAKESAYKAARKADRRTVFAPSRFVVHLAGETRATVRAGDRAFHVDLVAGPRHVHAVAQAMDDAPATWCGAVATRAADAPPSEAVRRLAIARLATRLDAPPDDLVIRRDGRIPTLWIADRPTGVDLSLAHHGRFVAFACRLP